MLMKCQGPFGNLISAVCLIRRKLFDGGLMSRNAKKYVVQQRGFIAPDSRVTFALSLSFPSLQRRQECGKRQNDCQAAGVLALLVPEDDSDRQPIDCRRALGGDGLDGDWSSAADGEQRDRARSTEVVASVAEHLEAVAKTQPVTVASAIW